MPPRPPARTDRGVLSRDEVIAEATRLLQRDGLAAVSIRSVATRLGVTPMALYRHVANKDDLLDEVVDRLFADRWRPAVDDRDWRRWITEAADRFRGFLVEQPAALHVYLRHPVVAPVAAERMDACLDVLTRGLGARPAARRAYAALQTYTIGFAALEANREAAGAAPAAGRARVPTAAEERRRRELASYSSPAQFRAGLAALLRGVSE
ncbi:MAG: TetR/AcrR family transcriptional regulator [Jatrophihabitans sp.]|uniref:TetR/AcrR family transcriptional regulator n=1 Tax=Jatrophihabitans sp. TaxID=1932789 RepID=UPI003F7EAF3F